MSRKGKIFLLIFLVILIDQIVKIYIKTHFYYHQEVSILNQNWAFLHFVENNGAAFGLSLGDNYGKLALTTFRIVTVTALAYFIHTLLKKKAKFGLIAALSLVLAGAIGNIIDSVFYGVIFSESGFTPAEIAKVFPPEGGYSSLFHGKVVDMFYFPMINTVWPEWIPMIGGNSFQFFRPVFNVADSSITIGMFILLLFYRNFFSENNKSHKKEEQQEEKPEILPEVRD